MSSKNLSRRELLQSLGIATGTFAAGNSPLVTLFESLVNGFVSRAVAEGNPRRYLYIQQFGAPPRWTFDLLLNPYNSAGFVTNPHIGTRYVGNTTYTDVEYSTFNHNGMLLPHMWQFDVPKAGGGNRPMTELITNMMMIQGVHTNNPGHSGAQEYHYRPVGATQSLTALSPDQSNYPFPAVDISARDYIFKSIKKNTAVRLTNGGDLLSKLLSPFISQTPSTFTTKKNAMQGSINEAISALSQYAATQDPSSASIESSRQSAETLLQTGFSGLNATWNQTVAKYIDLITRAIDPTVELPGINDKPIGIDPATRGAEYDIHNTLRVDNPDLRTMFTTNARITYMAEHFTVAEYVLVNNLSSSVTIFPRSLSRLQVNGANANQNFDEHSTGKMVSLINNTMYFRALSTCLLELIDQLKVAGIFSETVIDVSGEFNRAPRNDGTGSDHGWQGANTSLISGAIASPFAVGNIKKDSGNATYSGTWGEAGVVTGINTQLNGAHMAATVASLLRVPSPVTAGTTLAIEQGGTVIPTVELTKLV